jgi:four helix bundle protein
MANTFRDLKAWNLAMDLSVLVYALTADFPRQEIYGLNSQMRRASVSIASNIAEGKARSTRRDFRQFVTVAIGSNWEFQTQLALARRLRFIDDARITEAEALCHEVARMLNGLSAYLRKPSAPPNA